MILKAGFSLVMGGVTTWVVAVLIANASNDATQIFEFTSEVWRDDDGQLYSVGNCDVHPGCSVTRFSDFRSTDALSPTVRVEGDYMVVVTGALIGTAEQRFPLINRSIPEGLRSTTSTNFGGSSSLRRTSYGFPWQALSTASLSTHYGCFSFDLGQQDWFKVRERTSALTAVLSGSPWSPQNSFGIPSRVIPAGFVGDTAFFGTCWYACLFVPGIVRRRNRKAKGLCVKCGYDMRELATCPECGTS
jgi:hypothetical protein